MPRTPADRRPLACGVQSARGPRKGPGSPSQRAQAPECFVSSTSGPARARSGDYKPSRATVAVPRPFQFLQGGHRARRAPRTARREVTSRSVPWRPKGCAPPRLLGTRACTEKRWRPSHERTPSRSVNRRLPARICSIRDIPYLLRRWQEGCFNATLSNGQTEGQITRLKLIKRSM